MKTINYIYPVGLQSKAAAGVYPATKTAGTANQRVAYRPSGMCTMWLMVEDFDAQHLLKEFLP